MQRLMQQRWIKAIARITLISLFTQLMLTGLSQAADEVVYFHNDALGSPVAATDQSGRVLWREEYKPYGKRLLNQNESAGNKLWFTGKYEEAELGSLQYFGARWYHPDAGRFMSMDPAGVIEHVESNPMMFNRYAYGNNNPYSFVDPDGRAPENKKAKAARELLKALVPKNSTIARQLKNAGLVDDLDDAVLRGDRNAAQKLISVTKGKGLQTPEKYFGNKTYKEAEEALTKKFGPPRGGGKYNKSFYNEKTKRTYNLHQDPTHRGGKPHIDVRKRDLPTDYYKDRSFFLKEGQ